MHKNIDFLTQSEVKEVYEKLYNLKDYWVHRGQELSMLDDLPYYTLGAASYLDIRDPKLPDLYFENIKKYNSLLRSEFNFLYEKLSKAIETHIEKKACFHESFALPGFQIYQADWLFEEALGPYHCDLHYCLLDWQGLEFNPSDNLSFTASIRLPKSGGGVYMWEQRYEAPENLSFEEHRQHMYDIELSEKGRTYYQYQEGNIFFHSGNLYHQIAPIENIQNEDERITLQGHAVLSEDTYHIFW